MNCFNHGNGCCDGISPNFPLIAVFMISPKTKYVNICGGQKSEKIIVFFGFDVIMK